MFLYLKVLGLVSAKSANRWVGTAEQLRMGSKTPGVLSTHYCSDSMNVSGFLCGLVLLVGDLGSLNHFSSCKL